MTSAFLKRGLALLAILATSLSMVGCKVGGGGNNNGQANLRAINLTDDLPNLDLYVAGNLQFGGLTTGAMNSYASVDANTYSFGVNSAGNSATLFTSTYTLTKSDHYTAVIWGPQASLHISTLPEDDDVTLIATGNTRVRMFNATATTGSLDVYLTQPGADLTQTTPTQGALTGGTLAGFKEIGQGNYQLTVTGAGNPADVRLVVTNVPLTAVQYTTIILTAGSGGVLVNATMIIEQGGATAMPNTQARVRLVGSVAAAGQVGATVSGTDLVTGLNNGTNSSLLSPAIGQYQLVTAGTVALVTRLNGSIVSAGPVTFTAGADYTLMMYGPAASSQLTIIADNNKLPLSTTRTKIRLVNGVTSLASMSMLVDYGAVSSSSNVVPGVAAAYQEVASDSQAYIEVDSPSVPTPVYLTSRTNGDNLSAQGVYSMFVLDGSSAPKGQLRNERP